MAEPTLSPQLQQQLANLQNLNAQLQNTMQQRAQFDVMRAEGEQATQALETLADDAPVYRNVGALLVKDSRPEALKRLKEDQETLGVRIQRLEKQEATLREQAGALQKKIQAALPK